MHGTIPLDGWVWCNVCQQCHEKEVPEEERILVACFDDHDDPLLEGCWVRLYTLSATKEG